MPIAYRLVVTALVCDIGAGLLARYFGRRRRARP
jgi:hypothetical protein